MAETSIGDIVASLKLDLSGFTQNVQTAQQTLTQFGASVQQGLGQGVQDGVSRATRAIAQVSETQTQAEADFRAQLQITSGLFTQMAGFYAKMAQERIQLSEQLAFKEASFARADVDARTQAAALIAEATKQQTQARMLDEEKAAFATAAFARADVDARVQAAQLIYEATKQQNQAREQAEEQAAFKDAAAAQAQAQTRTQAQALITEATRQQAQQREQAEEASAFKTAATATAQAQQRAQAQALITQATKQQAQERQQAEEAEAFKTSFVAQVQAKVREQAAALLKTATKEQADERRKQADDETAQLQAIADFRKRVAREQAEDDRRLRQEQNRARQEQREADRKARQEEREAQRQGPADLDFGPVFSIAAGLGITTSIQTAITALRHLVVETVQTAAKMQDLHRSFVAIEGSGMGANRMLGQLFDVAQRSGVSFTTLADNFKRLEQAARGTAIEGQQVYQAFVNITAGSRTLGLSQDQLHHALLALEQALTKGKLSAEEYRRQLGNAIPGAMERMAEGFGISTRAMQDMISLGIVPAESAVIALGNAMAKIRDAGLGTSLDNLNDTFARLTNETTAWMTAIGEGIAQSLNPMLQTVIKISEALRSMQGIPTPGTTTGQAVPMPGTAGPQQSWGEWMRGFLRYTPFNFFPQPGPESRNAATYGGLTRQIAQQEGIDPNLYYAMVQRESRFDPSREGPVRETARGRFERAQGLSQMLPSTAAGEFGVTDLQQLRDPALNLTLGARLIRQYTKRIHDSFGQLDDETKLVLAAYNGGITRVMTALTELQKAGRPLTYENMLERLQVNAPRAVPEVRAYVAGITAQTEQVRQRPLTEAGDPLAPMLKRADQLRGELDTIQRRLENMNNPDLNRGGILGPAMEQQRDAALKKYQELGLLFATFPELWNKLTDAQKENVKESERIVLSHATTAEQLQLIRQQYQALEQTQVNYQARIISFREGPAAAEEFSRVEAVRLQQRQQAQRREEAMQTPEQQLASYRQRYQQLQGEVQGLGDTIEQQRVQALRPRLEAGLTAIQTVVGRAGMDLAEQARQNVLRSESQKRAEIEQQLREAQQAGMTDLVKGYQEALEALPASIKQQADLAYQNVRDQQRDTLRQLEDQMENIRSKTTAAGLAPAAKAAADVRLEYQRMGETLAQVEAKLREQLQKVPEAERGAIQARIQELQALREALPAGQAAETQRRTTEILNTQRASLLQATDQIAQIRERMGGAGLDPVASAMARVKLEFDGMLRQLGEIEQKLRALRGQVPEEAKAGIDQALKDIEAARAAAPAAMEAEQARRTAAIRAEQRATLLQITDQIAQIRERMGAAGLDPLALAMVRVRLEFDNMLRSLAELEEKTRTARGRAPEAERGAYDEQLKQIEEARAGMEAAVQAEQERRRRDILTDQRNQVLSMTDQLAQIQQKMGGAGLDPLAESLNRVRLEYAGLEKQLRELARTAEAALPKAATPELRQDLQNFIDATAKAQANIPSAVERALAEARRRPETTYLTDLQNQLDKLRQPGGEQGRFGALFGLPTQLDVDLANRERLKTGESRVQTDEGRAMSQALRAEIRQQEQLVAAATLFQELGTSVGNAWTQSLLSISDGTKTVAQAFRDMGRSIMQTLIQITSQEAWKALIQVGVRLILGSLTSGVGGGNASLGGASGSGFLAGITGGGGSPIGGGGGVPAFAAGGVVNRPTFAMIGEGSQPEAVVNRNQMAEILQFARTATPSAGGQAMGGISIINVSSQAQAEQTAAQQRAMGRQVVINHVLSDLQAGEASVINRTLRTIQR